MKKMLVDIVKGAAVFGAIGLMLGVLAPVVAPLLGAHILGAATYASIMAGTAVPTLWTGLYFAMFGALIPPVQKVWGGLFGDSDAKAAKMQKIENSLLEAKCMELEGRQQAVEQSITTSKTVESILARGANKSEQGFAAAEQARAADASTQKSL